MLQSLEIENFRQFSHFTIPKLGRINLLTGKNNHGKTSILEAIHLLMTTEHPAQVMTELQVMRGELSHTYENQKYASEIRHFFHNRVISNQKPIKISGLLNDHHKSFQIEIIPGHSKSNRIIPIDALSGNLQQPDLPQLRIKVRNFDESVDQYEGSLSSGEKIIFSRQPLQSSILQNQNSELVFLTKLTAQEAAYFYSQVVLLPEEERVLEAIRIIEPDIQRIAPKSVEVEVLGSMPKTGFFAKLKDLDEIVPIASMGDGLWNLMGIILILVNAKGKTLLIDEIDVGLHYSVMVDLWKLIWKITKELDIQVFATTHSQDCWKALGELIEAEEIYDNEIMIHRIDAKHDHSVSYDTDKIVIAAEDQVEVR